MPDPDIAGPSSTDASVGTATRLGPSDPDPRSPSARRRATSAISGPILERAISRTFSLSGLLFGAAALPFALRSDHVAQPMWTIATQFTVFGSIVLAVLAGVLQLQVRRAGLLVVAAYTVALVTWPLASVDPGRTTDTEPWLWYLLNFITGMAVVVCSTRVAAVVSIALPVVYGVVHALPSGGGAPLDDVVLDSVYALVLGVSIFALVVILRTAGRGLDAAQQAAVSRYAVAVREHATEKERLDVDAIMHDSVLATFLAAGRSSTDADRRRVTTQAIAALDIVDDVYVRQAIVAATARATSGELADYTVADFRARVLALCVEYDVEPEVSPLDPAAETTPLPRAVADAVLAAGIQALGNSYLHAGGEEVRRSITIEAVPADGEEARAGVMVVVRDDGAGFDTAAPSERLGVRLSIVERVARVGGLATITSAPGAGTAVSMRWPAPVS